MCKFFAMGGDIVLSYMEFKELIHNPIGCPFCFSPHPSRLSPPQNIRHKQIIHCFITIAKISLRGETEGVKGVMHAKMRFLS